MESHRGHQAAPTQRRTVVGFGQQAGTIGVARVALPGRTLSVNAEVFVLAAGGIDNPRLLLSSRPVLGAMGEAADNVGGAVSLVAEELKRGYQRIKNLL